MNSARAENCVPDELAPMAGALADGLSERLIAAAQKPAFPDEAKMGVVTTRNNIAVWEMPMGDAQLTVEVEHDQAARPTNLAGDKVTNIWVYADGTFQGRYEIWQAGKAMQITPQYNSLEPEKLWHLLGVANVHDLCTSVTTAIQQTLPTEENVRVAFSCNVKRRKDNRGHHSSLHAVRHQVIEDGSARIKQETRLAYPLITFVAVTERQDDAYPTLTKLRLTLGDPNIELPPAPPTEKSLIVAARAGSSLLRQLHLLIDARQQQAAKGRKRPTDDKHTSD